MVALAYDMERSVVGTVTHLRSDPVKEIKVNQGFGDDMVTNLAGAVIQFETDNSCIWDINCTLVLSHILC